MGKRFLRIVVLAAAMCLCLGLAGCGGKEGENGTLTVFNYYDYMDPEVLDLFEEETGIKILYEETLTPEEMHTKLTAGAIQYDVVCTSEYMLQRFIQEDLLQPIDMEKMEYSKNIGQKYWDFAGDFDPGNHYVVPYLWGTVGIFYDAGRVEEPIDSWGAMFDEKYADEIVMQKSMRDAYMVALKYLGYSMNTENEDEIREAHELLLKQKPLVQSYLMDEARDEVVAGNAIMAMIYSGEAYLGREYGREEGKDLRYVIPKEGSNVWIDCWGVTKNCQNVDAAMQFINFLCREDVARMNFEFIYYPTPNEALQASFTEEQKADELIMPRDEDLANCEVYHLMNDEATELMNGLWKELGAE